MKLNLQTDGGGGDIQRQLETMLQAARASFAARHTLQTLATLRAAHQLAAGHGLHRQAAVLKRALGILASGARPKLLTGSDVRFADIQ